MDNNKRNADQANSRTQRRKGGDRSRKADPLDRQKEAPRSLEETAAELDELAMVPTEVLADWVTDRGRCLWETTFGEPPEWSGENEPDRELATRLCAGCPVRAECLEFELRVAGESTVGVWGALNRDDRLALHKVWSCRRRSELEAMTEEEGGEWT